MENVAAGKSKPAVILKALVVSYIVTALLLLLLALLLFKFELNESKVSIGVIVVYLLSSFIGGWLAGRGGGSRKFLWGLLIGAIYFVLLLLISMIAGHGIQTQAAQMVTTALLCVGGGMLGGMLS